MLDNAAREPEVVDLARCLVAMGARITGAGQRPASPSRVWQGSRVRRTRSCPTASRPELISRPWPRRAGSVAVTGAQPASLESVLDKLREAGAEIAVDADVIRIHRSGPLKAANLRTTPHPGFPTDMQAQFMALATRATGTSVITETIFENRMMHVQELKRLGADIEVEGNTAIVKGVAKLTGADVMATDLRASACLVIAGLVAEGRPRSTGFITWTVL